MESAPRVESFPPFADENSRIVILGSMPGTASLRAHQYYGNPRNYLWRLLYALHDAGEPAERYEDRLAFAAEQGIALWDVIASCVRPGSLDSDIRDAVPNDVPGLLRRYPGIQVLACNGSKSYGEIGKRHRQAPELVGKTVLRLPSSSPIPTPNYRGFEDRLSAWRELLGPYLKK
jgi:TDG/mug DNA glycosylase family protein